VTEDIYRPDQWHDYFIIVGGASAALTGLVFVAMSLNVTQPQRHRAGSNAPPPSRWHTRRFHCHLRDLRSRRQDHRALGLEWLIVSAVAAVIYVYGYIQAIRLGESSVGLRPGRLIGGTALHVIEIVGAALLLSGHIAGLYLAAISMIGLLAYMISGAWLLIMGVSEHRSSGRDAS